MLRGMTLAALAVNCSLTASALAQNRPNLIFILTDDQGVDAIQWPLNTGHPSVQTPTMNALAAQGVSFANCRVNPNCSPTRACLMTGRYAIDTGVCGVLGRYIGENPCPQPNYITGMPAKVTNRLALQTQEKTLAEVLANLAEDEYYTVLIDKWHLGYNQDNEDLDLLAINQRFHKHVDWLDTICNDDPDETGDEHMTYAYQQALYWLDDQNRDPEHQGKPYALFFHTVSPHRRHADSGGYHWWDVDDQLIPLTKNNTIRPPDEGGQADRAIQNLEAIDTVIRWLLIDLEVIEDDEPNGWPYYDDSNTVVFFMSDNGTDPATCWFGNGNAKNTLYDGGIRVPMFVMGEGISTEQGFAGTVEYRPVTHVDVFETVCDIVDASASERGNDLGAFPRRSITFADAINWGDPPVEEREFTLCSLGESDSGTQTWKVALIWGDQWKLICASGGAGFADMETDEFYNLLDDPQEETNLIESNMSVEEVTVYLHLRDRIVDEWPAAVSQALPAQPTEFHVDQYAYLSPTSIYVLVVFVENDEGEMTYVGDEFYDHYNDPDHNCDLNISQCRNMTQWEQNLRDSLRAQMMTAVADGSAGPDLRIVDIALSSSLVMKDDLNEVSSTQPLTVGHQNVGGGNEQVEYRARLTFNFSNELALPDGFDESDLIDAQMIVFFSHDSALFDPESPDYDYLSDDRDTDVITLHKMLNSSTDFWNPSNFSSTPLGRFDPPPHIIAIPFDELPAAQVRVLPLPQGTPASFGHNAALLQAVQDWLESPGSHYGIMLKAGDEPLDLPNGDQEINFLREAVLRLTFQRNLN